MTIQHNTIVLRSALDWSATVPISGRGNLILKCRRILAHLIGVSQTDPGHPQYRTVQDVTRAQVIRELRIGRPAGYRAFRRLKELNLIRIFEDGKTIRVDWP